MRDAEEAVRSLTAAPSGPVALAVVGTLAGAQLTPVLKRFAARHPAVELTLRTAISVEVGDLVRRGGATIGLRYGRAPSPEVTSEGLGVERLIVVCATEHPLKGTCVPALAALRAMRWLGFPEVPGRREIWASHIVALFQAYGLGEPDWTPVDSLTAQKRL